MNKCVTRSKGENSQATAPIADPISDENQADGERKRLEDYALALKIFVLSRFNDMHAVNEEKFFNFFIKDKPLSAVLPIMLNELENDGCIETITTSSKRITKHGLEVLEEHS